MKNITSQARRSVEAVDMEHSARLPMYNAIVCYQDANLFKLLYHVLRPSTHHTQHITNTNRTKVRQVQPKVAKIGYVGITTYQPDTKPHPNPNPNHTTKQHAIV